MELNAENRVKNALHLKTNVEVAEAVVLASDKHVSEVNRPIILLATRNTAKAYACRGTLESYDYLLKPISQDLYGLDCNEWLATPKECSR